MNKKKPGIERRRFKRIPVRFDLIYKVNRPPSVRMILGKEELFAWLIDVSIGGMAIITKNFIPDGAELGLTFHLIYKDRQSPPMHALGSVCYSVLLVDTPGYRLGIEFTKISDKDRQRIVDFVKETKNQ
jgi:c-di-GMP-binding flagellar brake protein YcgR